MPAGRGPQFSDSVVLVGAAVAGLGIAIGRGPHVAPLLARGQLVRVTQESWLAPWSYYLMAPPAHFRRPLVRTFVDWALAEARADPRLAADGGSVTAQVAQADEAEHRADEQIEADRHPEQAGVLRMGHQAEHLCPGTQDQTRSVARP